MKIVFKKNLQKVNQKEFKKLVREKQEFLIRTFEDSYIKNYIILFKESQEAEKEKIKSFLIEKGLKYDVVGDSLWVSFDNYILKSKLDFLINEVRELNLMDNLFINVEWWKYPVDLKILKTNN